MAQVYAVPVIQQDLRQEETILQIADALDYLNYTVNDIFSRVENRIDENRKKLQNLNQRTAVAKAKVEKLTGSKKATKVFSSAKYPVGGSHENYVSLFNQNQPVPMTRNGTRVMSKHQPLESKVLQEKLQFYHVKVSGKGVKKNLEITPEEGLGSLPQDIDSISSLLLFNTTENPYKRYVMLDPLGAVTKTRQALDDEEEGNRMEAAPFSISQREQLERLGGDNYFYSPGLGEVPQIDVPLDLPDLPGIADDLRYSMDSGPMIAPSVSTTPAIPELPSLVSDSPSSSDLLSISSTQLPPSTSLELHPLPPPPPPPPPPSSEPAFQQASVPPPPPPPPPPPAAGPDVNDGSAEVLQVTASASKSSTAPDAGVSDAHANLMEAIRQAGGTGKAKLRSAKDIKIEAKKKKQEEKASGGGNLMADLHLKLAMRRKGISGLNKPENNVSGAMDRVSAMIPPPPLKDTGSSLEEDEEDWE